MVRGGELSQDRGNTFIEHHSKCYQWISQFLKVPKGSDKHLLGLSANNTQKDFLQAVRS